MLLALGVDRHRCTLLHLSLSRGKSRSTGQPGSARLGEAAAQQEMTVQRILLPRAQPVEAILRPGRLGLTAAAQWAGRQAPRSRPHTRQRAVRCRRVGIPSLPRRRLTSSCIVAPGLVSPGHIMLAPDSTNLMAPRSARSLGIMSGYCPAARIRMRGGTGFSKADGGGDDGRRCRAAVPLPPKRCSASRWAGEASAKRRVAADGRFGTCRGQHPPDAAAAAWGTTARRAC